jgi:hypothetical protein
MEKQRKASKVTAKSQGKSRKLPKESESPNNLGLTRSIKKSEKGANSKKITQVLCANSDESRSENFLQGQASIASVPNVIMTMTPASNLLSLSNRVPVHPFMLAEATPVAQTWASGNQGVNPMSVSSSSM